MSHDATPTVSVIVRSMDRSSLTQALDSIAAQTYPAVEVVIVNAKGAAHAPLPRRCGPFPIVATAGQRRQPLRRAAAANRGLQRAGGALALFLDDDDVLLPDHLQRLVQALQDRADAVAAYAGVEMGRDEDGVWQPLHRFDAPFDATRLLFENYLPMHGVLFRRNAATAALRLDEAFDLFEDWDWWLQLAALGPFVHVPGISARYRITGSAQSDVFADSPAAADARARLFEKWRHRISAQQHGELLMRAQALYREAAQQRDRLGLAQRTEADLRDVVAAREHDIAEAGRMRENLQAVVVEREREVAALRQAHDHDTGAARQHAAALQAVIDEREREIASLQALLQARERERSDATAHVANLGNVIAARETELANAAVHATELGKIVAARDAELASMQAELQRLADETLPQAVMRIRSRKKAHAPDRG